METGVDSPVAIKTDNFLDKLRLFCICSKVATLKETAECPVPSKPLLPPPLTIDRSERREWE